MILGEPLRITKQIADVFQNLKIHYMIGGFLASSLHGIPRATQDIEEVKKKHQMNINHNKSTQRIRCYNAALAH